MQIIALSRPQEVEATSTTQVQSTAINGTLVRIHAHDVEVRFLIGADPEATATSHYLAPYEAIDQPIVSGQKVSIYGGKAIHFSTWRVRIMLNRMNILNRVGIPANCIIDFLPAATKAKFREMWSPGNVNSSGNMVGLINGYILTVTGKDYTTNYIPDTSEATFAVPDNATFIADDGTDTFWSNASNVLQQKTVTHLISSTTLRTFIKYADFAPFNVFLIGILKAGEVITDNEKVILNRYFKLDKEYWGVLMDSGYMKDNRIGNE